MSQLSFSERHPRIGRLISGKSSRSTSPRPAPGATQSQVDKHDTSKPQSADGRFPVHGKASEVSTSDEPQGNPGTAAQASVTAENKVPEVSLLHGAQSNADTSNRVSRTAGNSVEPNEFQLARDALWKRAYVQFQKDEAELVAAYEKLIADQNALGDQALKTPEAVSLVVMNQKTRMENRQLTYPWLGRTKRVRDTVDSILQVIKQSAGMISAGMTMVPIYVSLPWSFVAILIPFVINDSKELHAALDGLREVASIMASYSYAEKAFLTDDATKTEFENIVTEVYISILEYQAAAAVYFAKSTLKRLGHSFAAATSWTDALTKVRDRVRTAQNALIGLDATVTKKGLESVASLLQKGLDLMNQIHRTVSSSSISSDQLERESILNWICADNIPQDHFNVEDKIGENYLGSGTWLIEDTKRFAPWLQSKDGTLLLQGIVGSGKSSLTCMVINHLAASSNSRIAFTYFSNSTTATARDQPTRNHTRDVIRRILKQCAYDSRGNLAKSIENAYNRSDSHSKGGWDINLGTATKQLQDVLAEHSNEDFIFVFDALDECSNLTEFLDCLLKVKMLSPNLKLFTSARFEVGIPKAFNAQQVAIDSSNSSDIASFIESEVDRRYDGSNWTAEQAERFKKALKRFAGGMFRWVELELDLFLPRSSYQTRLQMPADIDARLSKLERAQFTPLARLYNAYQDIWNNALGNEDEIARRAVVMSAMKWVLCAFRPLHGFELAEAASTQTNAANYNVSEEMLLGYCSNLIVKDSSGVVRLSHISVKQFFEEEKADGFGFKDQHQGVLITCMAVQSAQPRFKYWLLGRPDLEGYCFFHWPLHFRSCSTPESRPQLPNRYQLNSRLRAFIRYINRVQYGKLIYTNIQSENIRGIAESYTQSEIRQLLGDHERTEGSLLMTVEKLLNDFSLNKPVDVGQIFLRRQALQLVSSQVTILNPYGLSTKDLAYVLGAELFLKKVIIEAEIMSEFEDENLRSYAYTGFFDRRDRLSTFLSSKEALEDIRPQPQVDQHVPATPSRPAIVFERGQKPCNLCNLTQWFEGSRRGESFTLCASRQEWHKARQAGCELCTWAMRALYSQVGISEATNKVAVQVRVFLDMDSSTMSGSDIIRYFIPNLGHADLELCLLAYDGPRRAPSEILRGRVFDPEDLDVARSWRQECDKDHHCTSGNHSNEDPSSSCIPTRLIDVGDPNGELNPTLFIFAEDRVEHNLSFVYLSFNWGGSRPRLSLNTATSRDMMTKIRMHELSTIHRDAIMVCHKLGYRYLWVDALCIIQDDLEDWTNESPKMGMYLASADIVFAASSGSMNDDLMPAGHGSILATFQAHMKHDKDQQITVVVREPLQSIEDILNHNILSRRWRIQEALLPRRLLIFGKEQLHWVCQEYLASQSTTMRRPTPLITFPNIVERSKALREGHPRHAAKDLAHDYWHYVAELSSRGELAWAPDALHSVEGIASTVGSLTEATYCAGLWLENLVHDLLWFKYEPSLSRETRSRDGLPTAPTWSWASDTASISYSLGVGLKAFEKSAGESTQQDGSLSTQSQGPYSGSPWIYNSLWALFATFTSVLLSLHEVFKHLLPTPPKLLSKPNADLSLKLVDYDTRSQQEPAFGVFHTAHHRTATLRVSAYTIRSVLLDPSGLDQYQYFFDYEFGFGRNVRVADLTFVAVSPWKYTPQGDARWTGLMLEKVEVESETYERRGVFIGPRVEEQLQGWERSTITLR